MFLYYHMSEDCVLALLSISAGNDWSLISMKNTAFCRLCETVVNMVHKLCVN